MMFFRHPGNGDEADAQILAAKNALALRLLARGLSRGDMADNAAAGAASPWLWKRADFDACLDGVFPLTDEAALELAALREAIDKVLPP